MIYDEIPLLMSVCCVYACVLGEVEDWEEGSGEEE